MGWLRSAELWIPRSFILESTTLPVAPTENGQQQKLEEFDIFIETRPYVYLVLRPGTPIHGSTASKRVGMK